MAERKRQKSAHNSARLATTGSNLRLQAPKSRRKPRPSVTRTVAQEINPVGGFFEFVREHAVVGLAIGFVIGTQVQTLVKQLVSSFIDPLFKLVFGEALSLRTFTLEWHGRNANFGWGAFVYALLDFVFVLGAVYAIIKSLNLDELDKPKKKS